MTPFFKRSRRLARAGAFLCVALLTASAVGWVTSASAQSDPMASGVLLVQGNRLTLYADADTTDADQVLNLGERGRVRTCFGGPDVPCGSVLPGDPRVAGLVVRAELRGPELPQAVELETVPGGSFFLPSFQQEGDYRLENIRLISSDSGQVLGYAEPALALLHVREIVVASASVRTLSLEELRARGIEFNEENFQAFDFAVGFAIADEYVEIEFPVIYHGNGQLEPLRKPRVKLDGLPEPTVRALERWQPPQIVPFRFEGREGIEGLEIDVEERERLSFPLFGAIVIPGTVTFLNQFFEAKLVVANGAPAGSEVELQNLRGTLKLPTGNVLRVAQTEPPVAPGQWVPIVGAVGDRSFGPGEQGTAAWTLEGLRPGTHAVVMDIEGDLTRPGRDALPVLSRTQAAVEVVDARFNLTFSHPDVVREGEEYTLFVTVNNLSRVAQNLVSVEIRDEHLTGAHPADPNDPLKRTIETLEPGQSETLEFELVSELTGKVIATTYQSESINLTGTVLLRAGVGELGIPLSPATLLMPKYTEYIKPPYTVDDELVKTHVRTLGLAYSLAVAPAAMVPPGLPRVIKSDVERRAIDLAEAGQRIFLGDQMLESLHVLLLDQLGNRHHLEEYDELRRRLNKGLRASDQLAVALRREQENRSLDGEALYDHFNATMSYTRPYLSALLVPDDPALRVELHRTTEMGPGRLAFLPENEEQAVRTLPWAEMYRLDAGVGEGTGLATMAVVGHVGLDEVYRLELVNDTGAVARGRLKIVVPDGDTRAYREIDFGTVEVPVGRKVAVDIGAAVEDPGTGFRLYDPLTGASVSGSAQRSTVPLPPFRILGARQEFRLNESGPDHNGNWNRPNRYGAGLSYLFNRPPDVEAAQTAANYRLEGVFDGLDVLEQPVSAVTEKVGTGAWVQPNSERVVNVRFDDVISALMEPDGVTPLVDYEQMLDTSALVDTFGNRLEATVPKPRLENVPLHTGGLLKGKVKRGTGELVPGAKITLYRFRQYFTPLGTTIKNDIVATTETNSEGYFFFDYVEFPHWEHPIILPNFGIRAEVPAGDDPELEPAEVAQTSSRLRLQNRVGELTIALLGRGHITGKLVYLDDQNPVPDGTVRATSTLFNEEKSVVVEEDGTFRIPSMPVGPITLTGADESGRRVYATVGIERPGNTVDVHLEIQRQDVPQGKGSVSGRVLARDPETGENRPLQDIRVVAYTDGASVGSRTTNALGEFFFDEVPAGRVGLQAADWRISRTSALTEFPLGDGEHRDVDLLIADSDLRKVTGRVLFKDPISRSTIPIEGAVAVIDGPGVFAHADETGRYTIENVPVQGTNDGAYKVKVFDSERKLQGETTLVPILDVSEPVIYAQDIILEEMEGSVRGVVLDPLGRPVAGAQVVLYPLAEAYTSGDGSFRFDRVPVGNYTAVAHWGDGLEAGRVGWIGEKEPVKVIYGGHEPFVTVRMRGSGRLLVHTKTATATGILTPIYYRPTYYSETSKRVQVRGSYFETTTNQLGTLELEVPVGNFELVAYNPFHGIREISDTVEYAGQVKELTIVFEDAGTVRGQVVDVDGKTPVPDIQVELHTSAFKPQTQYTDAQGYFQYELVPKGRVAVTAHGIVGTVERVGRTEGSMSLGGQVLDLVVQMKAQGSVEGQVLEKFNGDLRPLPFAQYYVQENTYPFRRLPEQAGTFFATDGEGKYRQSHLYAGRVTVVARDSIQTVRKGQASAHITADWQVVAMPDIVMSTSIARLEAIVRDPETGGPVADAQIRLSNGEAATSNDQGIVIFDALPLGNYSIYAFDAPTGRSGRISDLRLTSPGQRLTATVYLDSRGEVRGTLYDDPAKTIPVPGGIVQLSGQTIGGGLQALATTSGQEGSEGRFSFGGIPEGDFKLVAALNTSPRRAYAQAALTETAPIVDIAMVLEQVQDLYFRMMESLQAGEQPVDLTQGIFNLTVSQGGGYSFSRGEPEPGTDVFFYPEVLSERSVSVDARELDGEQRRKTATIKDLVFNNPLPGVGTLGDPFRITLAPKGTVRVTVYDAVGSPVPYANVNLRSSLGRFPSVTNEQGQVTFYAVPAGRLTADATASNTGFGGRTSGELTYDDDFIDLTVQLAPVVRARGVVYQPVANDSWNGDPAQLVPAEGIIVEMRDSTRDVQVALTDANGEYSYDVLAVGNYTLKAQDNNGDQVANAGGSLIGPDGYLNPLPAMILDASPPRILSIVPPVGTEGVSRLAPVEVVFSEPLASSVLPGSNGNGYFKLRSAAGATPPGTWSHSLDGQGQQVVRFVPSTPYDNLSLYSLTIVGGSGGIRDQIGRRMTEFGNVGSNFKTSDSVGPAVIGTEPALDLPVNPEAPIRVDFNESVVAENEALDGDLHLDAATLYGENGNGDFVPLPVVLYLTRNGYSLQVEPIQGLSIEGDTLRRRLVVDNLEDIYGNAMPRYEAEFRIWDARPPRVDAVPFPDSAPDGQLFQGATYTVVPLLSSLDDVTAENPGGDLDRVEYFFQDPADPTNPSQPGYSAQEWPYSYTFIGAYSGNGTDPKPFPLWVRAVDTSTNESDVIRIDMLVLPNSPPTVDSVVGAALEPVAGTFYAGSTVQATVVGLDDLDGNQLTVAVELWRDGQTFPIAAPSGFEIDKPAAGWSTLTPPTVEFDLPLGLEEGTPLFFKARIYDSQGALAEVESERYPVADDATPPTVDSLQVRDEDGVQQVQFYIGQRLRVRFRAVDAETAVRDVTVTFDRDDILASPQTPVHQGGGLYETSLVYVPPDAFDDTTLITVTVTATDYGETVGERTLAFEVAPEPDPTAPDPIWLTPWTDGAWPADYSTVLTQLPGTPLLLRARVTDANLDEFGNEVPGNIVEVRMRGPELDAEGRVVLSETWQLARAVPGTTSPGEGIYELLWHVPNDLPVGTELPFGVRAVDSGGKSTIRFAQMVVEPARRVYEGSQGSVSPTDPMQLPGEGDPDGAVFLLDGAVVSLLPQDDGSIRSLPAVYIYTGGEIDGGGQLLVRPSTLTAPEINSEDSQILFWPLELEIERALGVGHGSSVQMTGRGLFGSDADTVITLPGQTGPGVWAGGSHGGRGWHGSPGGQNGGWDRTDLTDSGSVYDSVRRPSLPGSGGRTPSGSREGARGGGVIDLRVPSGVLHLAGDILARGETPGVEAYNVGGGGGAGGAVYLEVGRLEGGGRIDASGGRGLNASRAGGGGGGRVAVRYGEFAQDFDPATQILAQGGTNHADPNSVQAVAGAGTVYLEPIDTASVEATAPGVLWLGNPSLSTRVRSTTIPAVGRGVVLAIDDVASTVVLDVERLDGDPLGDQLVIEDTAVEPAIELAALEIVGVDRVVEPTVGAPRVRLTVDDPTGMLSSIGVGSSYRGRGRLAEIHGVGLVRAAAEDEIVLGPDPGSSDDRAFVITDGIARIGLSSDQPVAVFDATPAGGDVLVGSSITLAWQVSDPLGLVSTRETWSLDAGSTVERSFSDAPLTAHQEGTGEDPQPLVLEIPFGAEPGEVAYTVEATDVADRSGTASVTWNVLPNEAPTVTVGSVQASVRAGYAAVVDVLTTDREGLATVSIEAGGPITGGAAQSAAAVGTESVAQFEIPTDPFAAGDVPVVVRATVVDASGESTVSAPFELAIVPNDLPLVTLSVAAGAASAIEPAESTTVAIYVEDPDGLEAVELVVDGELLPLSQVIDLNETATAEVTFDVSAAIDAAPGFATVRAIATDRFGAVAESEPLELEILPDTVPPTFEVAGLAPSYRAGETVELVVTTEDAVGTRSIEVTFDGEITEIEHLDADPVFVFETEVDRTLTTPRTAQVEIVAYDFAGNASDVFRQAVDLILDEAPTVQLTVLPSLTPPAGTTLEITAEAQDDVRIERVEFNLSGAYSDTNVRLVDTTSVSEVWRPVLPTTLLGGSTMTLAVDVLDSFGHASRVERTLTVAGDDLPPEVEIFFDPASDGDVYTAGEAVMITAVATDTVDVSSLEMTIAGQTYRGTSPLLVPWTVPSVAEATDYLITAEARDPESNVGTAQRTLHALPLANDLPPHVEFDCPTTGAVLPSGLETLLQLTATDDQGIARVDIYRFGEADPLLTWTPESGTVPEAVITETLRLPTLVGAEEEVRLRAVASDAALNTAEDQIVIRVVETIDIDAAGANDPTLLASSIGVLRTGTWTVDDPTSLGGLIVLAGASVTHSASSSGAEQSLDLTVDGPVYVACGGAIDARGRGYGPSESYPGAGVPGTNGGGSHIGFGGFDPGTAYGSVYRPVESGGGGGTSTRGVRGGGVIRLSADSLVVDGAVRADGGLSSDFFARAGAGGSVWLTIADAVSGGGTISALGGSSNGGQYGSGGGGAIAVEFGSLDDRIRGSLQPYGGSNHRVGGAGSVYLRGPAAVYGDLVVDSGAVDAPQSTSLSSFGLGSAVAGSGGALLVTDRAAIPAYFVGHWVEIFDGATEAFEGAYPIVAIDGTSVTLGSHGGQAPSVQAGDFWQGAYYFDNVTFRGAGLRFTTADPLRVSERVEIDGAVTLDEVRANDMVLRRNATLDHPAIGGSGNERYLDIELSGDLLLEPGARIDVSGLGYGPGSTFPGETGPGSNGGGSHLGLGGFEPGSTYGSVYRPLEAGGGGATGSRGQAGGGVVRIQANDLIFADDTAAIAANGQSSSDFYARGGAGGSVWIELEGVLRGNGLIEARGSSSNGGQYGSGGGGAISISHRGAVGTALDKMRAWGGDNNREGGAGTVYVFGPDSVFGDMILDNGSVVDGTTVLPSLGSGIAGSGSGGSVLVTGLSSVPSYFVGHWVEIRNAAGDLQGSWRIEAIDGGTVTLAARQGSVPSVAAGDRWQGVYRFDNYSLVGDVPVITEDPVRVTGVQEIQGEVEVREIVAGGLVLRSGSVLRHPATTDPNQPESLRIELTGDLVIEPGAAIDVTGGGYPAATSYVGETVPGTNGGGSHMGLGGYGPGTSFGSVYRPQENGGAGATGSRGHEGGGTVRIRARNLVLEATDSAIRANGRTSSDFFRRGGAGGSVWVTLTGQLSGAGSIEAKGSSAGDGQYGSGGGGAIAIEHEGITGTVGQRLLAQGGGSYREGGAGTVWTRGPGSTYGDLLVDAGTVVRGVTELPSLGSGAAGVATAGRQLDTGLTSIQPYFMGHWVEIYDGDDGGLVGTWRIESIDGGLVTLEFGASVAAGDRWQGVYRFDDVVLRGDVDLVSHDPIRSLGTQEIDGVLVTRSITGHDLVLRSGAHLSHPATTDPSQPERLDIRLTGDLTVESGASIDATGRGFGPNVTYPNEVGVGTDGGGSHLGMGGNGRGSTYGSVYFPAESGAGGGSSSRGRRGGGVVYLEAVNVRIDGDILANGEPSGDFYARGAAGGSIWIDAAGIVSGSGSVQAGGSTSNGGQYGSGGGGAIAIYHHGLSSTLANNVYTYGGDNHRRGGAGSIYLHGPTSVYGDLQVDNSTIAGNWTQLPALGAGVAGVGSSGSLLDTDLSTPIQPYFIGHWVEIYDGASGELEGVYRITAILDDGGTQDGTQVLLASQDGVGPQVDPGDSWQGVYLFDHVRLIGDALPFHSDDPVVAAQTESIVGTVTTRKIIGRDLTLAAGSTLTHPDETGSGEGLDIALIGDLHLGAGAAIDVSGRGYRANVTHPSVTLGSSNSGGSHLGVGGFDGGETYGSVVFPWEHGAGGASSGGKPGGGRVRILARDLVFADAAAAIRANGIGQTDFFARGGAGGSIWIELSGRLAGDGSMEARGGASDAGSYGSGGGGVVSVRYDLSEGTVIDSLRVWGGDHHRVGGAGVVVVRDATSEFGTLIVDNNGIEATTRLPALGQGVALAGSAGATLVTDRTTPVPDYFLGHWVEISSSSGVVKGMFQIQEIVDGTTLVLAPDDGLQPSLSPSDLWRGVYRFDEVVVSDPAILNSDDAVFEAGVEILP